MPRDKIAYLCSMKVDMVGIQEVVGLMEGWINSNNLHNYIVVSNADTAVKAKLDSKFRQAVNSSSLSIPDGISLTLWGRVNGFPLKNRTYGPDLMLEFLRLTQDKGYSHFFYGTTEDTLKRLIENLQKKFPKLRITGSHAPPFRSLTPEEDNKIVNMINNASPSILWVGIGCPKQELWMFEHKDMLRVPVMVGVGAAFDFLAGTKPQAPRWIRESGFEWLFRLLAEPKRLWRRYLVNGSLFIYYASGDLFLKIFKLRCRKGLPQKPLPK